MQSAAFRTRREEVDAPWPPLWPNSSSADAAAIEAALTFPPRFRGQLILQTMLQRRDRRVAEGDMRVLSQRQVFGDVQREWLRWGVDVVVGDAPGVFELAAEPTARTPSPLEHSPVVFYAGHSNSLVREVRSLLDAPAQSSLRAALVPALAAGWRFVWRFAVTDSHEQVCDAILKRYDYAWAEARVHEAIRSNPSAAAAASEAKQRQDQNESVHLPALLTHTAASGEVFIVVGVYQSSEDLPANSKRTNNSESPVFALVGSMNACPPYLLDDCGLDVRGQALVAGAAALARDIPHKRVAKSLAKLATSMLGISALSNPTRHFQLEGFVDGVRVTTPLSPSTTWSREADVFARAREVLLALDGAKLRRIAAHIPLACKRMSIEVSAATVSESVDASDRESSATAMLAPAGRAVAIPVSSSDATATSSAALVRASNAEMEKSARDTAATLFDRETGDPLVDRVFAAVVNESQAHAEAILVALPYRTLVRLARLKAGDVDGDASCVAKNKPEELDELDMEF